MATKVSISKFSWVRSNTELWGNGKITMANHVEGTAKLSLKNGNTLMISVVEYVNRPGEYDGIEVTEIDENNQIVKYHSPKSVEIVA